MPDHAGHLRRHRRHRSLRCIQDGIGRSGIRQAKIRRPQLDGGLRRAHGKALGGIERRCARLTDHARRLKIRHAHLRARSCAKGARAWTRIGTRAEGAPGNAARTHAEPGAKTETRALVLALILTHADGRWADVETAHAGKAHAAHIQAAHAEAAADRRSAASHRKTTNVGRLAAKAETAALTGGGTAAYVARCASKISSGWCTAHIRAGRCATHLRAAGWCAATGRGRPAASGSPAATGTGPAGTAAAAATGTAAAGRTAGTAGTGATTLAATGATAGTFATRTATAARSAAALSTTRAAAFITAATATTTAPTTAAATTATKIGAGAVARVKQIERECLSVAAVNHTPIGTVGNESVFHRPRRTEIRPAGNAIRPLPAKSELDFIKQFVLVPPLSRGSLVALRHFVFVAQEKRGYRLILASRSLCALFLHRASHLTRVVGPFRQPSPMVRAQPSRPMPVMRSQPFLAAHASTPE